MEVSKIKIGRSVYDIKDKNAIGQQDLTNAINQAVYGQTTKPSGAYNITSVNIATAILNIGVIGSDSDTMNTAGATNKAGSLLFLVGASSLEANPITYSNSSCYIGSDNCLYTNGKKTVTAQDVTNAINTELYGNNTKPNGAYAITSENISTILQNAGVVVGGVTYPQVEYAISRINGSGALTIPGTSPVYVVTVSANISSVALQSNPVYGHSCHVIFKSANASSYTVTIGHDNTNRICPTNDGITLTVPAANQGYVEVDFLNVGNSSTGDEIYVRGL